MITVRGVDVRVGARLLLSGISFHVSPGDRIGLVGPNGAGKTTLLSTLAGRDEPVGGRGGSRSRVARGLFRAGTRHTGTGVDGS